jgi:ADP-heptose:LPS heptosyltransferase
MRNFVTPHACSSAINRQIHDLHLTRVLALHAGALGDFVLALHVLSRLRGLRGDMRIDVVARSPLARWLSGRGIIDHALDYESCGFSQLFSPEESARVTPELDAIRGYDLVLNFMSDGTGSPASGLRRVGVRRLLCIDPAPAASTLVARRHITEQWMRAVADQGLDLQQAAPTRLQMPDSERELARRRLAEFCGRPEGMLALIHPGSGGRAKCAPLSWFEAHVDSAKRAGNGVAWMIGPTEVEWYGQAWIKRLQASAPVLCEEDIGRAAEWIRGSDRYIGNDAGMTHVAALLGVETLAVFGPTDPKVWGPLGTKVTCLRLGTFI